MAATDKAAAVKGSIDKTLSRLSTWTSVALVIGILAVPLLPSRGRGPAPVRSASVPSLGHTPAATPPAARSAENAGPAASDKALEPSVAPAPETWSDAEQVSALRECLVLLAPLAADVTLAEPMRQGQCGSAAPLRLHSLGAATKVVFDPAPEMNCKLAAGLSRWVDSVLQPAAHDVLGARIVRIVGASSYSCRNIYNRTVGPLSEHATGNAVDIAGFVTSDGRTIMVAKGWGPTERDIAEAKRKAAEAAKAKARGEKDTAKPESEKEPEAKPAETKPSASRHDVEKPANGKSQPEKRADTDDGAEASAEKVAEADTPELAEPEHLEAPTETGSTEKSAPDKATSGKPGAAPSPATAHAAGSRKALRRTVVVPAAATLTLARTTEATFLKRLHQGACGVFGTVLGPEANDAHRNHFHFDMKERRISAVCH